MIITITRKTIPFKEVIVEDLTCPISGRIEPMRLILSKEETNAMGMSVTIAKKCSGRFYQIGTDQIIHPRNWTTEMKSLFQQHQAQNFPVEGAGRRFTRDSFWLTFQSKRHLKRLRQLHQRLAICILVVPQTLNIILNLHAL